MERSLPFMKNRKNQKQNRKIIKAIRREDRKNPLLHPAWNLKTQAMILSRAVFGI